MRQQTVRPVFVIAVLLLAGCALEKRVWASCHGQRRCGSGPSGGGDLLQIEGVSEIHWGGSSCSNTTEVAVQAAKASPRWASQSTRVEAKGGQAARVLRRGRHGETRIHQGQHLTLGPEQALQLAAEVANILASLAAPLAGYSSNTKMGESETEIIHHLLMWGLGL